MNEILFGKNGKELFFWFPPAASFFLSLLSLSAPVSRWHWAECNFTGKYSGGKSYHGMWVPDSALVKFIEVFQFKCICLSLGLNVECEPLIVSITLLKEGKSRCRDDDMMSECSFSRMSWSYYTWLQWMGGDRPVVITLSPHQQYYSGISWGLGREAWCVRKLWSITWSFSSDSRALSLSLSLKTKFVEKPHLHFLPNLMKHFWMDWKYCEITRVRKRHFKV